MLQNHLILFLLIFYNFNNTAYFERLFIYLLNTSKTSYNLVGGIVNSINLYPHINSVFGPEVRGGIDTSQ